MKIAIATRDFTAVSGHAGQTRHWLLYDLSEHRSNRLLPAPRRIDLAKDEVLHVFEDDRPHPLDGARSTSWSPPAPATASSAT